MGREEPSAFVNATRRYIVGSAVPYAIEPKLNEALLSELNDSARAVCNEAERSAANARIKCIQPYSGSVLDFAPDGLGTLEGGLLLTRICMADLGKVSLLPPDLSGLPLRRVQVSTDLPLHACIAAQYAGWPFSHDDYFAMCSGPARIARGHEDILTDYELVISQQHVVGVFESRELPGDQEIQQFAEECQVSSENVTLCVAPTASLPAAVQIVGRSIETTMHKLHELNFDLRAVKSAIGNAPLPPIPDSDLIALGWTNDAILYGADVMLWVDCDDDWLRDRGPEIPSNSSSDFGRPFQEIFAAYDHDFYQIDKHLFSPARVTINNVASGKTHVFGKLHYDILEKSFRLNS